MTIEQNLERIANALEKLVNMKDVNLQVVYGPSVNSTIGNSERYEVPQEVHPLTFEKSSKTKKEKAAAQPEPAVEAVYTKDQVWEKLRQHANIKTADTTKALMKKYGAKSPKVDEIPAENYAALMAEMDKNLEIK